MSWGVQKNHLKKALIDEVWTNRALNQSCVVPILSLSIKSHLQRLLTLEVVYSACRYSKLCFNCYQVFQCQNEHFQLVDELPFYLLFKFFTILPKSDVTKKNLFPATKFSTVGAPKVASGFYFYWKRLQCVNCGWTLKWGWIKQSINRANHFYPKLQVIV